MVAPFDLAPARLISVPGTLIRSPKVHITAPFSRASIQASSIKPMGVTHTGQPGPEISSTLSGRSFLMPSLKISWV